MSRAAVYNFNAIPAPEVEKYRGVERDVAENEAEFRRSLERWTAMVVQSLTSDPLGPSGFPLAYDATTDTITLDANVQITGDADIDGTLALAGATITGAPTWSTLQTLNTSGNAATATLAAGATALANARTIGGVSFDGTANITVASATGGFTVSGGGLVADSLLVAGIFIADRVGDLNQVTSGDGITTQDLNTVFTANAGTNAGANDKDAAFVWAVGGVEQWRAGVLGATAGSFPAWVLWDSVGATAAIQVDQGTFTVGFAGHVQVPTLDAGTVLAGLWQGSPITEAFGGTAQSTYAKGDMLIASAVDTLAKLAVPATDGWVLTFNDTTDLPEWRVAPSASGAPDDAVYIVGAAHAGLSAERVGTDTGEIDWDFGTAGQAKLNVLAIAASKITAGTFGAGAYVFPANLTVNGTDLLLSNALQTTVSSNGTGTTQAGRIKAIADSATLTLLALGSAIGGTTFGGVTGNNQVVIEAQPFPSAVSSFYIGTLGAIPMYLAPNRVPVITLTTTAVTVAQPATFSGLVAANDQLRVSGTPAAAAANSMLFSSSGSGDSRIYALGPNGSTPGTLNIVLANSDFSGSLGILFTQAVITITPPVTVAGLLTASASVVIGSPTGGDMGAGTLNADTGIYVDGVAVGGLSQAQVMARRGL